ncbi:class I SAM-dependent methyltransferase [Sphingobium sp. CAP-1]|uniref:class I SAM-dependent methyltransferase n=1 Tax=Sphingobium sp. CAP-1 TaxID=2676077 RepID=UPI0012BB43F3|nr:methyltransferase domain-containing protein [Sphingobium sp. CAP-1]QGP79806.1 methyltransferase [Sphingobium sp. CAP-1]
MASIPLKKKKDKAGAGSSGGFFSQWGMFFRQFVKHPGMIGSVIPSSAVLVDRMLDQVDWRSVRLFVEYGPGVGTFTRPILDRLPADATLLAIDLNLDFVAYLEAEIADPRLRVVHGSAADVRRFVKEAGHYQADYVLSGIPFSTLPDGLGDSICAETRSALRPGGAFLIYQYSRYVRRFLTPLFDSVEDELEWRNIPPCRMIRAEKQQTLAQAA